MKTFYKKKFIICIIALIILICFVYSFPRDYRRSEKAMYYKLGDVQDKETRTIDIVFDGKYKNRILFGDKFEGKISIDEKELEVVKLDFKESFDAGLNYYYFERTDKRDFRRLDSYGWIYTKGNLKEFVIAVLGEQGEKGSSEWHIKDGYVIATPCVNRKEAINLTGKLMGIDSELIE